MNARDEILTTLCEARGCRTFEVPAALGADHFADRPLGDSTALINNFKERLAALKGETYVVTSVADAKCKLLELTEGIASKDTLYSNEPIVTSIMEDGTQLMSLEDMPHQTMKNFEVGVTGCLALVARTGSVIVSSTSTGRRMSVLPPFHIVVATRSQLVTSLEDVFGKLDSDPLWSYAAVITGPSRTADIEKILVLGAHGPKKFSVILIDA